MDIVTLVLAKGYTDQAKSEFTALSASGLTLKGSVSTREDLPASPEQGWVYGITDEDAMVAYVGSSWLNVMAKGDTGPRGPRGYTGQPGLNGNPGQDGYSPSASVTKTGKVATITITDKSGTTTAQISDGEGGGGGNVPSPAELDDGDIIVSEGGEWKTKNLYTYKDGPVQQEIEWDGDSSGRDSFEFELGEASFYKVSEIIDILPDVLSFYGCGKTSDGEIVDEWEGELIKAEGISGGNFYLSEPDYLDSVCVIEARETTISIDGQTIIECPSTGIYFFKSREEDLDYYASKIEYSVYRPIIPMIKPEYISADGYGYMFPPISTIEWDGDTSGRDTLDVGGTLYKVSDYDGSYAPETISVIETSVTTPRIVQLSREQGCYVYYSNYTPWVIIVTDINCVPFGEEIVAPSTGIYFYNDNWGQFVTTVEFNIPETPHKIAAKYLDPEQKVVTITYDENTEKWSSDMTYEEILAALPNIVCQKGGTHEFLYNPSFVGKAESYEYDWIHFYRIVQSDIDSGVLYSVGLECASFGENGNVVVSSGQGNFSS